MNEIMPTELAARIEAAGIIAVLVISDVDKAAPLAQLLLENGISAMELTLRTNTAFDCLEQIRKQVPGMLAGVGTILNTAQVSEARSRGAAFGVAPGFNREVVEAAFAVGLPFAPGIATPSEIEAAFQAGCKILKFFPAEGMGGLRYLDSVNSPYKHLGLRYIPLGGLGPSNLEEYLRRQEIIAIGGSWIAPQKAIEAGDWKTIAQNALSATETVHKVRRRT